MPEMKTPHWALPDIEPPEVDIHELWHRAPRARKPHTCTSCGKTIEPGERYHDDGYTEDGDFRHDKTCEDCSNPYLEEPSTPPRDDSADAG
jgi:predicted RNA-binding Zn-ribbon protein involved in translation (DUF1610 family)